jgi:hypothetical protein
MGSMPASHSQCTVLTYVAGLLVLVLHGAAAPNGAATLIMQSDGNLVLYNRNNRPLWATMTNGYSGAYFVLQDDGNAVVYQAAVGQAELRPSRVVSGSGGRRMVRLDHVRGGKSSVERRCPLRLQITMYTVFSGIQHPQRITSPCFCGLKIQKVKISGVQHPLQN